MRNITVVFEFDETWDNYDDVIDELVMEEAISCLEGVGYSIMPDSPPQDKFGDCSKLEEALEQSNKEYANQCPPECKWELYSEEENVYGTSCDNLYQIMNGSPKDNEMEYCSYCGKKIALKPDSPPYNADPHHKR